MDGKDFLNVAQSLIKGRDESEWRSAVSRGYYAVFHVAKEFIISGGLNIPQSSQGHEQIKRYFVNCNIQSAMSIGSQIDTLRSVRNRADYKLTPPFSFKKSSSEVAKAKKLIDQILNFDPNTRNQIITGMMNYENSL